MLRNVPASCGGCWHHVSGERALLPRRTWRQCTASGCWDYLGFVWVTPHSYQEVSIKSSLCKSRRLLVAGSVVAGLGLAPDGGAWARESLLCQGWDWAGGGDTGGGRMEFCNFDSDTTSV